MDETNERVWAVSFAMNRTDFIREGTTNFDAGSVYPSSAEHAQAFTYKEAEAACNGLPGRIIVRHPKHPIPRTAEDEVNSALAEAVVEALDLGELAKESAGIVVRENIKILQRESNRFRALQDLFRANGSVLIDGNSASNEASAMRGFEMARILQFDALKACQNDEPVDFCTGGVPSRKVVVVGDGPIDIVEDMSDYVPAATQEKISEERMKFIEAAIAANDDVIDRDDIAQLFAEVREGRKSCSSGTEAAESTETVNHPRHYNSTRRRLQICKHSMKPSKPSMCRHTPTRSRPRRTGRLPSR